MIEVAENKLTILPPEEKAKPVGDKYAGMKVCFTMDYNDLNPSTVRMGMPSDLAFDILLEVEFMSPTIRWVVFFETPLTSKLPDLCTPATASLASVKSRPNPSFQIYPIAIDLLSSMVAYKPKLDLIRP
mgnify:CR=1 FL=1